MSNTPATNPYFDNLIGKEIKGAYRIDRKLGAGGMGAVFLATQLKDDKKVAIKVLSPHLIADPKFIKRFQREAKVGSVLNHPNIVKVFDFGEVGDQLVFMAMEYVEGETLKAYLTRTGPL